MVLACAVPRHSTHGGARVPKVFPPPATYQADPDHPLRWGVVGTGNIAHTVMSDLLLLPDARLVAVCSRSADRGSAYASELSVPAGRQRPEVTVHQDLSEMLAEIDVLYVATPHAMH